MNARNVKNTKTASSLLLLLGEGLGMRLCYNVFMKIIVGLGNPEEDYFDTRHNIGWMMIDAIAKKYEGIDDAYAFEAGRELRVIINPTRLDDAQTVIIAEKIREEVTKKLIIPGEVKVTAIREFRSVSSGENI